MSTMQHLYKRHVRGTEKKAVVRLVAVFLCHLTVAVSKGAHIPCSKVYVSTRVIKHIYDKRPAEEFDYLMEVVAKTVKYPDQVYQNKQGKRGSYCFVKTIKNQKCFVSLEVCDEENFPRCEIVTFYRVSENYLSSYKLLWEWEGGESPS